MPVEQYVCTVCGFNIIGGLPERCPFCGASKKTFLTSEQCSARYEVQETPVTKRVSRLNSTPALGFEHAAYRIETIGKVFMIDCPSCFDKKVRPATVISFTHHHFLGASNQYRDFFGAEVRIHDLDSKPRISQAFPFDTRFEKDWVEEGIEACPVDGHTPGFTIYFFEDCLFICDYVFVEETRMVYNPFGPAGDTIEGGNRILEKLKKREIRWVCGYNYVLRYSEWYGMFSKVPVYAGH
ncbi:MAG: MBL fold metallo-hydrolase [Deltaproteobacteria bacterium HGW-Deltaproteobacteria-15]|jgi:glyoxylase-like metal-dependent hydrolase (beta-lactamase superfamily II)|nr:MAG: MBL fold metallo-hydrolase [Deltaproteobacteria bacterium HGW-Deltaproteobacteria-15]